MVTPKEDSSGKKSPSLRNTSQDQSGDCQSKISCQAADSQHTKHLQVLASVSHSYLLINIALRGKEQKDISVTG